MTEKSWLGLILLLFVGLGLIYAITTPAFEASDELWHYPMVRHLADGNPLPVQVFDPAQAGPMETGSQPAAALLLPQRRAYILDRRLRYG